MNKEIWFDLTAIKGDRKKYISYSISMGYNGIFIDDTCLDLIPTIPNKMKVVYHYKNKDVQEVKLTKELMGTNLVVVSEYTQHLDYLKKNNIAACSMAKVIDKESMYKAIEMAKENEYLLVEFEDTTNIPLELIVAFSQTNNSKVLKRVKTTSDGWIATMTMEEGSFGVLLSSTSLKDMREMKEYIMDNYCNDTKLNKLTVERIVHIGMGDRVCIDTVSNLKSNEGMLIGSTSTGGVLVSSENHYLPYMELRPFRVNAGAIHSYIFCENNTTKYLSELKAGDRVMVVDTMGKSRITAVGRVKMERRPMLLIECKGETDVSVNVIVQDDWHIRLLSEESKVCSATELKRGDVLLGISCESGRHLGVKILETIVEK